MLPEKVKSNGPWHGKYLFDFAAKNDKYKGNSSKVCLMTKTLHSYFTPADSTHPLFHIRIDPWRTRHLGHMLIC